MDLDVIESFLSAAEALSFSRAAATLGISQPAVSRHIQRLEERVGAALFLRDRNRIALTARGEELRVQLSPVAGQLRAALDHKSAPKTLSGRVRIACLHEAGSILEAAIAFQKANEKAIIECGYLSNPQILNALKNDQVAFGVLSMLPRTDGIRAYRLPPQTCVLVCRRDNPLKIGRGRTLSVPFVRYRFHAALHEDQESFLTPYLKRFQKNLKIESFRVPFAVNSIDAIIEVAARTECFAVVPLPKAKAAIEAGRLRMASERTYEKPLYFVHRASARLSPAEQAFKDLVLDR